MFHYFDRLDRVSGGSRCTDHLPYMREVSLCLNEPEWIEGCYGAAHQPMTLAELDSPLNAAREPRDGTVTLAVHRALGGRCKPCGEPSGEPAIGRCDGCVRQGWPISSKGYAHSRQLRKS